MNIDGFWSRAQMDRFASESWDSRNSGEDGPTRKELSFSTASVGCERLPVRFSPNFSDWRRSTVPQVTGQSGDRTTSHPSVWRS